MSWFTFCRILIVFLIWYTMILRFFIPSAIPTFSLATGVHENAFIIFMFCSMCYMLTTCILFKWTSKKPMTEEVKHLCPSLSLSYPCFSTQTFLLLRLSLIPDPWSLFPDPSPSSVIPYPLFPTPYFISLIVYPLSSIAYCLSLSFCLILPSV